MFTRHEELIYWYTHFEDPNCLAVVELVATVMDTDNNVQVYGVLHVGECVFVHLWKFVSAWSMPTIAIYS